MQGTFFAWVGWSSVFIFFLPASRALSLSCRDKVSQPWADCKGAKCGLRSITFSSICRDRAWVQVEPRGRARAAKEQDSESFNLPSRKGQQGGKALNRSHG